MSNKRAIHGEKLNYVLKKFKEETAWPTSMDSIWLEINYVNSLENGKA